MHSSGEHSFKYYKHYVLIIQIILANVLIAEMKHQFHLILNKILAKILS
jgi:hypothetical protein